jgi:hypothetical protein
MRPLLILWLACCASLTGLSVVSSRLTGGFDQLTYIHLVQQDLPLAFLGGFLLFAGLLLSSPMQRWLRPLYGRGLGPPAVTSLVLAVAFTAYAGVDLVFQRHALSGDELMAVFDTAIFESGRLATEVAPEWRPFVPALQPVFRLEAPGQAWWVSAYLPVNAMIRSLFGRLGDPALAGPFWAAASVLLVYSLGRRLRPERPAFAWVAALLLATSSQLLITAMTPYAMSAHLGLNLLWLLLVLRGGLAGHAGAVGVAFAATGLHQLIFHPLFAAPFVLRLWLKRRWAAAALHTVAYLVIGLFWTSYQALALPTPPAVSGASLAGVLETAMRLGLTFERTDAMLMAGNLLRFVTWQNPLTIPLLLLGAAAARRDGVLAALLAGLLLTTIAMAVILPYQAHGWGYRYLHGLLGSACLIAAGGWSRVLEGRSAPERRGAWGAFAAVCAGAILLLLPVRAWQTHTYVQPFAAASRAIGKADADVVLVDAEDVLFGEDLVRNDPLLRNRPKVMLLRNLTLDDVAALCAGGKVVVFGSESAARFGLRVRPVEPTPEVARLRQAAQTRPCAARGS